MSAQGWQETLVAQNADGAALTNSTTATSVLSSSGLYTFPANFWQFAGKTIRITAAGRISTVVTTPGTLTFNVRLGATTVQTSGALALNVNAKTNVSWTLQYDLTCRAVGNGTTTTLLGIGAFTSEAVIGSPAAGAGGSGVLLLPASAPVVGTGFDWSVSQLVDLQAAWSIANAANSIQTHLYKLEALN